MKNRNWMLYGANGYTGQLIAKEAVSRGHKPVLAGRSAEKLIPLANNLNLDYKVFDLTDSDLQRTLSEFDLVFNAAGPYIHTSAPIVQACLQAGTNYLDVTGEIPVLEQNFKLDTQARQKQISIISGVGFDVIPTDCLAKHVSEKISDPTHLELAIAVEGSLSPGTLKTVLEHFNTGLLIRKNGQLIKPAIRIKARNVSFSDKVRTVVPAQWADLVTAYITTRIPNINVYAYSSPAIIDLIKSVFSMKDKAQEWISKNVAGPDELTRNTTKSYVWARVANDNGDDAQAWLETMEGYRFTAVASVRSVEKVFELTPIGSLSPTLAFGKDFVLEIPETMRYDRLEVLVS